VRLQLRQEGRSALQTSGNGDRREVLAALYGADVARQMLEVISEGEMMSVHGFISPTKLTRASRQGIFFFVNGRPVQDPALSAALVKAYHTLVMVGRYPLAVLFIQMSTELVDVNVHPAKAEVRFRDPSQVFTSVQSAVRRALLAHSPVQDVQAPIRWSQQEGFGSPQRSDAPVWGTPDYNAPSWDDAYPQSVGSPAQEDLSATTAQPELTAGRIPLLRAVGQVASAYLVAEGPDGLYLIDQHAAHERVLFERFMSQHTDQIPSQTLLQPASVELPSASARLLEDQVPTLAHLGFQIEEFGPNTFMVRAIPALLAGMEPAEALRVLVEDFEEDETPLQSQIEARIIARVCKRAAIKAGQSLSSEEQRALIQDLENCQSPRTCPHGRPTMIHLSVGLLERQFGRKGAR
jgi:DNA mismatch repair protein MutL